MDKIAAYNQGVIEGLSTLDLPQNIKLAAARYLLGGAAVKKASLGGLSINNIVNRAKSDVSSQRQRELSSRVQDDLALADMRMQNALLDDYEDMMSQRESEATQNYSDQEDMMRLYDREQAFLDEEASSNATRDYKNQIGMLNQLERERDLATRDYEDQVALVDQYERERALSYDADNDDQGPPLEGMGNPYDADNDDQGPPVTNLAPVYPTYLQTALNMAKKNPGMAAAAGLGAAGLGYGAYRALR